MLLRPVLLPALRPAPLLPHRGWPGRDGATPLSGTGFTFASRTDGAYPYGALPSLVTADTAAADASCLLHFKKLIDHHLATRTEMPGLPVGGMAPRFYGRIDDPWFSANTNFKQGAVSEGVGYWMLLAVIFHGASLGNHGDQPGGAAWHPRVGQARPTPKQIFDAMLTTALAFPAYNLAVDNPGEPAEKLALVNHLMEWVLNGNANPGAASGGVIGASAEDGYNAVDGDLDIALACLMADRQWGSRGVYNYHQLALQRIAAMKAWNCRSDGSVVAISKPAGWGGYADPAFALVRTSDFMFNHFRAFARATGDPFWMGETAGTRGENSVYSRALWFAEFIQTEPSFGATTTGLMPDHIEGELTSTAVSAGVDPILPQHKNHHSDPGFVELITDNGTLGNYGPEDVYHNHARKFNSNATRVMLRLVTDYVFKGNADVKVAVDKMSDFWESRIAANAGAVGGAFASAYDLDGTPKHPFLVAGSADTSDLAELFGSILAGFCSDAAYATSADKMWRWCRGETGGRLDDGYYAGEIEIMGRLVAAGLWWEPYPDGPIPAPTIDAGEAAITAAVASATASHWGDFGSLSRFHVEATGGVVPGSYSGPFGRLLDRSGSGRDLIETDNAERPLLGVDGDGKPYGQFYAPSIISGIGATTGDFYYVLMVNVGSFSSTIVSSMNAANQGIRYRYDGPTGKHFLDRGIGSDTKTAEITADPGMVAGKYLIALRCVGGVLGIRRNKGPRGTMVLGAAAVAGAANLTVNANVDLTSVGDFNGYGHLFLDGYCPSDADQDLIETEIASKGSLTI